MKQFFEIKKMPKHLIILGGGPIGSELGQGFRLLGAQVSIIDRAEHLFSKDDPEASIVMEKRFINDGIKLFLSSQIKEIQKSGNEFKVIIEKRGKILTIKGDTLLVASGRTPSTKGIGLETLKIKINQAGYIITNSKLQTNIKNIYSCGDATGPYLFTHTASYQAGIIVRNLLLPFASHVNYSRLAWTTYTRPEVAHIGYTEQWARSLKSI